MTAFLYGYTHELSGAVAESSTIMSFTLSVITSLINVPFLNFIMRVLLISGKAEFAWRYPFIYREIKKIIIFEEVYYNKKSINNNTSDIIENDNDEENIITNILVNYIFRYICFCFCRKRTKNTVQDKDELFKDRINKEITKIKDIPLHSKCWYTYYLPFHTSISMISFIGCVIYLLWTINYLLLFSADVQPDIQVTIIQSFGMSQLFSIFVMTPITLLITLLLMWLYHKYIRKTSFGSNIVPLYYHSDPYISNKSYGLTVRLTKSLFLKSIGESSINQPSDPKLIAPAKGLIAQLLKEEMVDYVDKEYYEKVIKYNKLNKYIVD